MICRCPFKSNKLRLLFGSVIFLIFSICATSWPATATKKNKKNEVKVQVQQRQIIHRLEKIENSIKIKEKI